MPYIGNTTADFSINTGNVINRAITAIKLSPSSVGSNGQVLSVDGSGNLQWSADASGTSLTGSTNNTITTVTGANAIQGEANLTFDGSTLGIGASGTITTSSNFSLNSNALIVTGGATVVGEFKGATIPTVQITQTTNNTDLQLRANSTGALIRTATSKPLVFGTNQVERMRLTSAGHLLLSQTTSNWGTSSDNTVIQLENSAIWDYAGVQFDVGYNYYYDGTDYHFIRAGYACRQTFHNNDGAIKFWSGGTGSADGSLTWTERVKFTAGGDVSIQTDSKKFLAGAGNDIRMFHDGSDSYFDSITGNLYIYNHAASNLHFGTNGTTKATINSDGNLGIGTTSPVASAANYNGAAIHLHQTNSSSAGSQIHLTNGATGAAAGNGVHISMWSDDDLYISNQESDGLVKIGAQGGSEQLIINNGGIKVTGTIEETGRVVDMWRLHTNFSGDKTPIDANWERVDNTIEGGGSLLGTGMSESSGIFTFPSTGWWRVDFASEAYLNGDDREVRNWIYATTDNSSYSIVSFSAAHITQSESSNTHVFNYCTAILDITNTTDRKVRFHKTANNSSTTTLGSTNMDRTYTIFTRLGDT